MLIQGLARLLATTDLPRQRALALALRQAIHQGQLLAGARLPASRALAADLGIARNTVLYAYEQLVAEGYLVADRQGTRVANLPVAETGAVTELPALSTRATAMVHSPAGDDGSAIPFALGGVALEAFPFRRWRAAMDRAWQQASARQLGYAAAGGEMALREAIADHLRGFRGLPVTAAQVLITSGTQAALDLVARVFADSGDIAWVENPGYVIGRAALSLAGLQLHPVAVDGEGMAPQPDDWKDFSPRLIVLTPSHQFPSGRVLSLARRMALVEQAARAGAWLVEDDYGSEYFACAPLPPLFGLRPNAPVLYVGGFSKTLYPGLRLGYLIVPAALAERVAHIARSATRLGQGIEQAALADFLRRGDYIRHLRNLRAIYAERRDVLCAALRQGLGNMFEIEGDTAGLHIVLHLPNTVSDVVVSQRASEAGLLCRPLSQFCLPPLRENGLVLGYGAVPAERIAAAVTRLVQVIASVAAGRAGD